jgi:tyrosinase
LDPIFWLHHCNVDRIWESWAVLHNWIVPSDKLWSDHKLGEFYDPVSKQQVSVQCAQTVNSVLFGARYDRLEQLAGHPASVPLPSLQVLFGPGEAISAPSEVRVLPVLFSLDAAKKVENKTIFDLILPQEFDALDRVSDQQQLGGAGPKLPAVFLLLDNVPIPPSPTTMLRIFINVAEPSASTPLDDPGHVAVASFFGNFDHHQQQKTADFSFNITSNIARLTAAGRRQKSRLNVTLFTFDVLNPGGATLPQPALPAKLRIVGLQ